MNIQHEINDELVSAVINEVQPTPKIESQVLEAFEKYYDEDNWESLNLIYYGEPKAQARARINTTLNFFYDPSKSLKQFVLEQVKHQLPKNFKPISNEIRLKVIFYKVPPKSTSKLDKILMEMKLFPLLKKPDVDNYVKLILDSVNNVLYTDDSVITCLHVEKYYSCKPRVEIEIKFRK